MLTWMEIFLETYLAFAISLDILSNDFSSAFKPFREEGMYRNNARSFKTAIYGTFVQRMRQDVRYCFDKNHDERAWYRN